MVTLDFTLSEYLALEEICQDRLEYLQDKVFAIAGGTLRHHKMIRNLIRALEEGLGMERPV